MKASILKLFFFSMILCACANLFGEELSNKDINNISKGVGGLSSFLLCSGIAGENPGNFSLGLSLLSLAVLLNFMYEEERKPEENLARQLVPFIGDEKENRIGSAIKGALVGGAIGLAVGGISKQ